MSCWDLPTRSVTPFKRINPFPFLLSDGKAGLFFQGVIQEQTMACDQAGHIELM